RAGHLPAQRAGRGRPARRHPVPRPRPRRRAPVPGGRRPGGAARGRLGWTAAGEGSRARRRRSPMTTTDITPVDFDEAIDGFDPVLGIEVHVELGTVTKMFDGAPNIVAAAPNTAITPTSLGLPGSLPVVNGRAVEYAIRIG